MEMPSIRNGAAVLLVDWALVCSCALEGNHLREFTKTSKIIASTHITFNCPSCVVTHLILMVILQELHL